MAFILIISFAYAVQGLATAAMAVVPGALVGLDNSPVKFSWPALACICVAWPWFICIWTKNTLGNMRSGASITPGMTKEKGL